MVNEKMENKDKNGKKGLVRLLTVVAYVLLILGLVAITPVVCPPILGYHTYQVNADYTGFISPTSNLVYVKYTDNLRAGNVVAIQLDEGSRDVAVGYVASVDEISVNVEEYEAPVPRGRILGKVVAKTPFVGYLSQMCFSTLGKIFTVLILAIGILTAASANKLAKQNNEQDDEE